MKPPKKLIRTIVIPNNHLRMQADFEDIQKRIIACFGIPAKFFKNKK